MVRRVSLGYFFYFKCLTTSWRYFYFQETFLCCEWRQQVRSWKVLIDLLHFPKTDVFRIPIEKGWFQNRRAHKYFIFISIELMNSSEEVYVHCLRLKFQFNYVPNLNWQSLSKIVSKSLKILLQSVLSKKEFKP